MSLQRVRRADRSKWIAKQLYEKLDLDGVKKTMVIVPRNVNMKKRKWRRMFGFLAALQGRVYTKRVCESAVRRLLRMLPFQINIDPQFPHVAGFVAAQASLLNKVAKAAKRMEAKLVKARPA